MEKLKDWLYELVVFIARVHDAVADYNRTFSSPLTDKEMHFVVVGGVGLLFFLLILLPFLLSPLSSLFFLLLPAESLPDEIRDSGNTKHKTGSEERVRVEKQRAAAEIKLIEIKIVAPGDEQRADQRDGCRRKQSRNGLHYRHACISEDEEARRSQGLDDHETEGTENCKTIPVEAEHCHD